MKKGLIRWQFVIVLTGLAVGCFPLSQSTGGEATSEQSSPAVSSAATPSEAATTAESPTNNSSSGSSSSNGEQLVAQQPNCNSPQTQADINSCAIKSSDQADDKLNQVYQELRSKLQPNEEESLISAQRAWIEFRDKNCAFSESRFEGGSIAPTVRSSCIERVTKQRTEELQGYLQGAEGNFF